MTNEHTSLEKYTSHTLFKRVAKGLCVRGELETEQTATYWPPSSSDYSSTSFSFCWAAQLGVLRFSLPRTATNWLQLTQLSVAPGYIIVWHPPASCERGICTEFNPSTVKVIPWYLRPDAPVIYTGASLNWQLGRGSICNSTSLYFSDLRWCAQSKFSSKGTVNSITKPFFALTDQMTILFYVILRGNGRREIIFPLTGVMSWRRLNGMVPPRPFKKVMGYQYEEDDSTIYIYIYIYIYTGHSIKKKWIYPKKLHLFWGNQ